MRRQDRHRWSYRKFKLLQFIPTDRYQAVFVDDNHEDGKWSFFLREIEGIALAEVETIHMSCASRDKHNHPIDLQEEGSDTANEIVSIALYDTGFDVCESMANFVGLIRRGEKPSLEDGGMGTYAFNYDRYKMEDQRPSTEEPQG